jgi:hypothetical protein
MSSSHPAPPLPQPQHPAAAATALSQAAQDAARAWSRPLDPAQHSRAISQLYSALRDLGIAARGLAVYQTHGVRPSPESTAFPQHVTACARSLLNAWQSLDGVLAAEGISPADDPGEPGAGLCSAARNTLLAWREPSGTAADRDATVKQFITATSFVSAATLGLTAYAPRRRAIELQAVGASLAEAIAQLTAAIQQPGRAAARSTEPARGIRKPQ